MTCTKLMTLRNRLYHRLPGSCGAFKLAARQLPKSITLAPNPYPHFTSLGPTSIGMTSASNASNANITICKPPQIPVISGRSIFLAGSTEMDKVEDWQTHLTTLLSTHASPSRPLTILNPRRVDWDSSWKQDISDERFRKQVEWELDCQDNADVIAMFFHPDTKAPISLLELGLCAASGKMVVCCREGFHRRGNVQVVCKRFGIEMVDTLDELAEGVVRKQ